jgi:tripartite-type tricarboxylate transporter receptor subunit TctC
MLKKMSIPAALFVTLCWGLLLAPVQGAQPDYPKQPIDCVVGFAPGGSTDTTARVIAPALSKMWKQPVNIVNMPGGSSIPAVNHVMRAQPDGYTMLFDAHSSNSMLAAARKDLPFKWDQRTPVARLYLEPVIFMVKADSPWKTLKDVIAAIKANPKGFQWGSGSASGTGYFAMAELFKKEGIDFKSTNCVVFPGGAPCLTALAGGHVSFAAQQMSEGISFIQNGMIRGLGIVLPERAPQLPDIPTHKEIGYPDLQTSGWTAISGPPKLPQAIVDKWASALKEAVADPEVMKKSYNMGKIPGYQDTATFKKYMADQFNLYVVLAEGAGIRK